LACRLVNLGYVGARRVPIHQERKGGKIMAMAVAEAKATLAELGQMLGPTHAEAILVLLADHEALSTRKRVGSRERTILEYMASVPGVPMTPGAVQVATGLAHNPAAAMQNLAAKGLITRMPTGALYVYENKAEGEDADDDPQEE
jgi:hypothetical protein